MKVFVVLAVVAYASANPQLLLNGVHPWGALGYSTLAAAPALIHHHAPAITYAAAPAVVAPAVTKTQYHAQDELGQASFGHAEPGAAHAAIRDAAGNVRGSYAYINPDGKEIRVEYTAGHGGFQVASNALPIAPVDTNTPAIANLVAPLPVQDTPEVAEAKAAHARAVADAVARNAAAGPENLSRRKRGIIAAAPLAIAHPAAAVTYSAIAHPAVTYSAIAPAAPVATVVAAPTVREATLTKVVNNPLHAVSYRVD